MNAADTTDGEIEAAELQLPMLGLYADLELGRGSVSLPDDFTACSCAVQIEVITDWQRALAKYREHALVQMYLALSASQPELDPGQRLERFRSTCDTLGIEVPADIAGILQQY
jgi:hypothetical protein